jgi:flagellar basal-body rod modification protein FlgD
MAIDPTAAAGAGGGASATGRTRMADSYESFMSLLTAQIKNQDPLSPMDSTQFTQQLVQMTGVEQQLLTNDLLEKLVTNTGSGIQTSVSLLGREVRAVNNEAKLTAGKADWNYKLDKDALDVSIDIVDGAGKVVRVIKPTENKAGDHTISWDGKDHAGQQLPNGGTYTVRITAKDAGGGAVGVTNFVKGVVTGVEQVDGKTLLTVNGVKVSWENVTSIAEAPKETETPEPEETV